MKKPENFKYYMLLCIGLCWLGSGYAVPTIGYMFVPMTGANAAQLTANAQNIFQNGINPQSRTSGVESFNAAYARFIVQPFNQPAFMRLSAEENPESVSVVIPDPLATGLIFAVGLDEQMYSYGASLENFIDTLRKQIPPNQALIQLLLAEMNISNLRRRSGVRGYVVSPLFSGPRQAIIPGNHIQRAILVIDGQRQANPLSNTAFDSTFQYGANPLSMPFFTTFTTTQLPSNTATIVTTISGNVNNVTWMASDVCGARISGESFIETEDIPDSGNVHYTCTNPGNIQLDQAIVDIMGDFRVSDNVYVLGNEVLSGLGILVPNESSNSMIMIPIYLSNNE